ncbi:hypothetical protein EVAR_69342_1 [Eumeta japonica]|uniref:Uncharacterized protein n=1 Tax=Eumeta variegata TaxID=151549 RepID=A0A4C2A5S9_EUMVA|nr:hypothetical protein EVAR_69342_1 [Eumeta japonica]
MPRYSARDIACLSVVNWPPTEIGRYLHKSGDNAGIRLLDSHTATKKYRVYCRRSRGRHVAGAGVRVRAWALPSRRHVSGMLTVPQVTFTGILLSQLNVNEVLVGRKRGTRAKSTFSRSRRAVSSNGGHRPRPQIQRRHSIRVEEEEIQPSRRRVSDHRPKAEFDLRTPHRLP